MKTKLINFALFQAGWFACVLGAAQGYPWLGVLVVGVVALIHLRFFRRRRSEAALLIAALMGGAAADLAVVQLGFMSFPEHAQLGWLVPLWMPMMWVNFAMTLHLSMRWMLGRYAIGALFGGLGGPLAYYTGAKLGAIELTAPLWLSLSAIGVQWAVAMPVLIKIALAISKTEAISNFSTNRDHQKASS